MMERLQRSKAQATCAPKLNPRRTPNTGSTSRGAETETGQREAQGRNRQLQRTAQVVEGGAQVIG
jgi:hypothetical protein